MSQLIARKGLRSLLVRGRVNRNMFVHDWCGGFVGFNIRSEHVSLLGSFNLEWRRMCSASGTEKKNEKPKIDTVKKNQNGGGSVAVPSYWGIETAKMKIARKDGSKWPWNSFMPWETHQADLSIDVKKHHVPKNIADKVAYVIVKLLRIPTDIFFQRRYGCRAMMLETVAAVPGMVGGMLLHLKSIRRFEHSGGWIKALLEEAENERMHLMTMMELVQPKWHERLLVILVQGVFFSSFFTCYVVSPRLAHRIVGYLEEEAIHSYTEFLKDIDDGKIENVKAPAIAIDYWRLPEDATLKDVVTVIRADEAHHRDVNHFASDIRNQGKELREAAAPIGYH
ncbi:Ubiquinol oxidase 2 [Hirschfeldia incana]|nr:Ubiquinol oxidase 2 [Hirschfeldia incana]